MERAENQHERYETLAEMEAIVKEIQDAITNPGMSPTYHAIILEKHRRQWPTLWAALDKLLLLPKNND